MADTAPVVTDTQASTEGGVPPEGAPGTEGGAGVPATTEEKAAAKEAARQEAIRLHKLKVDGQEIEVDDDELKRGYQLSKTGYKRLEEAAALRKQLEGFIGAFQKDPVATLRQLASQGGKQGTAFREAVEKFLYEEMQREQWSPEKRALWEAEQKLAATQREKEALAEQRKRETFEAQQKHWAAKYEADITAAISAPDVGLPKTPAVVRRMAELMAKSLKLGLDTDPKDIAKLVRQELLEAQKEVLGGLDGEALMKLLGPDLAKRIRAYEVAQLKTRPSDGAADAPKPAARPAAPAASKKTVMRERDFDAFIRERARQGG